MQSEILYNRLMNQDFILDQNEELTSDNVKVTLWDDGVLELESEKDNTLIYTLSAESISDYQPITEKEIAVKYDETEKLFIQFF